MTTHTASEARTAALKAARAKDSNDKRQSALAAVESLERAGAPVTFTSVANTAGVSSWLVRARASENTSRLPADARSTTA